MRAWTGIVALCFLGEDRMNVYECLRGRRTVRRFMPAPVPETIVTKILKAARWAPSSRNQQPWHLVVIRNRETLAKIGSIARTGTFIAQAPVAIAVVMDSADSPEMDAGRAFQRFGLAIEFISLHDEFFDRWVTILLKMSEDQENMVTLIQTAFQEYLEETDHFKNPPKDVKKFVTAVTRRFEAGLSVL